MDKVINLTPHDVIIIGDKGNHIIAFPPSGEIARCKKTTQLIDYIKVEGKIVPMVQTTYYDVTNLPEKKDNTYYIVSKLVAEAEIERTDLLIVNQIIRDSNKRVIGCKSLGPLK